jgi:hypothetical protein
MDSVLAILGGVLAWVFLLSPIACLGIWLWYRYEVQFWKDRYYDAVRRPDKRTTDLVALRVVVADLARLANPPEEVE